MKAKKVFLFGGIGNQLFQLTRAYQHLLDKKDVIVISFGTNSLIYKFLNLTQHKSWIDIRELSTKIGIKYKRPSLIDIYFLIYIFIQKRVRKENSFDTIYSSDNNFPIDIGYFQSTKHVSIKAINKIADLLIEYLSIENQKPVNDFSIHIRGTMFGNALREHMQFTTSVDSNKALEFAIKNNFQYKIVTNSKNESMQLFPSALPHNYTDGQDELDDFKYLCLSKNLFVSNSTFSFWALICSKKLHLKKYLLPEIFWFNDFFNDT